MTFYHVHPGDDLGEGFFRLITALQQVPPPPEFY